MPKSKPFCIAVEGATTDGREIQRDWIEQMAATYAPATYTARVNCEHIRGFSPEPPFNAYGDVVSLSTQDVELELGGKKVKKLGLFAVVDASEQLVALQRKGQKLFSSIEVNPAFAGTGKAYLMGLAATDSPASLGTEVMQFAAGLAAKDPASNPFASRKQAATNLFSAAAEMDLQFVADAADEDKLTKLFAAIGDKIVAAMGVKFTPAKPANDQSPPAEPAAAAAPDLTVFSTALKEGFAEVGKSIADQGKAFSADVAALRKDLEKVRADVETTADPKFTQRPKAGGGDGRDLAEF